MADIGGIKSLSIDGATYPCRAVAEIRYATFSREAVAGPDGPHGTILKGAIPGIDLTISDAGDLDIERLQHLVDVDISIEMATGKVVELTLATALDQISLSPETGEIAITFSCWSCQEV